MADEQKLSGPDFAQGIALTELTDGGMLQGNLTRDRFSIPVSDYIGDMYV
jgi:hypothetical protein